MSAAHLVVVVVHLSAALLGRTIASPAWRMWTWHNLGCAPMQPSHQYTSMGGGGSQPGHMHASIKHQSAGAHRGGSRPQLGFIQHHQPPHATSCCVVVLLREAAGAVQCRQKKQHTGIGMCIIHSVSTAAVHAQSTAKGSADTVTHARL